MTNQINVTYALALGIIFSSLGAPGCAGEETTPSALAEAYGSEQKESASAPYKIGDVVVVRDVRDDSLDAPFYMTGKVINMKGNQALVLDGLKDVDGKSEGSGEYEMKNILGKKLNVLDDLAPRTLINIWDSSYAVPKGKTTYKISFITSRFLVLYYDGFNHAEYEIVGPKRIQRDGIVYAYEAIDDDSQINVDAHNIGTCSYVCKSAGILTSKKVYGVEIKSCAPNYICPPPPPVDPSCETKYLPCVYGNK